MGLRHGHGRGTACEGVTEVIQGWLGYGPQGREGERGGSDAVGHVGGICDSKRLSRNVAGDHGES